MGAGPAGGRAMLRQAARGGFGKEKKTNYAVHVLCTGFSQEYGFILLKTKEIKFRFGAVFQIDFC